MKRSRIWTMGLAALLVGIASAAWGNLDSPAGVGFSFPVKGTKMDGFTTLVFRGYDNLDLTASSFETVAQLRYKKELHVMRAEYDCAVSDPCGLCSGGRLDVTQAVSIALCMNDLIEPEVIADFQLTATSVDLQSVNEFVSEVDPADPTSRAVGAEIVVVFE